ncbi:hypothetical protein KM043_000820 [Ampulex compressa]|nr:hypothetical protein KM043_000820 [Ampulex compressa]
MHGHTCTEDGVEDEEDEERDSLAWLLPRSAHAHLRRRVVRTIQKGSSYPGSEEARKDTPRSRARMVFFRAEVGPSRGNKRGPRVDYRHFDGQGPSNGPTICPATWNRRNRDLRVSDR